MSPSTNTNKKPRKVRKKADPSTLEKRAFARRVKTMFTNMGFDFLRTEGREKKFGLKTGELDAVFVYENIILICEDTTAAQAYDHAKNKKLLAEQIVGNKTQFINWLEANFESDFARRPKYAPSRYRLFYLYFSLHDLDADEDQLALLEPMRIVSTRALNYFYQIAQSIKRSSRSEFFRYLGLSSGDIGTSNSAATKKTIETTIISPADSTGFANGVRVVSFMISAESLLRNSYVLRKDNWEGSVDLYQRLVERPRIQAIRRYIASNGSSFLNNIIVSLPDGVLFHTPNGSTKQLEDIEDYSGHQMTIPDEFNTIGIIDGQHRVLAHYEGTDPFERDIAEMRRRFHLLATGLVFPEGMSELERRKFESSIFVDINSNTKKVPADVILAIETLRHPFSSLSIARQVLEDLNQRRTFRNQLQLSQIDNAPIRVASIIKFALRKLVDIDIASRNLYHEWVADNPDREKIRDRTSESLLRDYVKYCGSKLDMYFGALKASRGSEWLSHESRVTSITSLNGMIIALQRSLDANGLLDFNNYKELFDNWQFSFKKGDFKYASSQYNLFSLEILRDAFQLTESGDVWVDPSK